MVNELTIEIIAVKSLDIFNESLMKVLKTQKILF